MAVNAPLNRKLRMGLVGGGQGAFIGRVHCIAAVLDNRAALVAGALSSDPARAKASAPDYDIKPERAYGSYKDMIDAESKLPAGERIDFVSVATPNHTHFEIAKAFGRGRLQCHLRQAHDLRPRPGRGSGARWSQKSGVVFAVSHNYTGYPLVRQAREMVQAGELGEINAVRPLHPGLAAHAAGGQDRSRPAGAPIPKRPARPAASATSARTPTTWPASSPACCPSRSRAILKIFESGRPLDDYGTAAIRFQNGALGTVTASQISHGRENDLWIEVDGTKGRWSGTRRSRTSCSLRCNGKPHQLYTRTGGRLPERTAAASAGCPAAIPRRFSKRSPTSTPPPTMTWPRGRRQKVRRRQPLSQRQRRRRRHELHPAVRRQLHRRWRLEIAATSAVPQLTTPR